MRQIGPGGRASGTDVVLALMQCRNLLASSSSRSLNCPCGVQTSSRATSFCSSSRLPSSFHTLTDSTRRYCVSHSAPSTLNRAHDLLKVWLRPSKQIRAPLYSIKQKRQRRMIVSLDEHLRRLWTLIVIFPGREVWCGICLLHYRLCLTDCTPYVTPFPTV